VTIGGEGVPFGIEQLKDAVLIVGDSGEVGGIPARLGPVDTPVKSPILIVEVVDL
jgi:hypothetical protein